MTDTSSSASPRNVVVLGADGSAGGDAAAAWAADEASRRDADLHLLHVWSPVVGGFVGAAAMQTEYASAVETAGWRLLDQLAERLGRTRPGLTITTEVRRGDAGSALCEQSRTALMTVVGARGTSRVLGVLLGSVSLQLVSHGSGPIVVVRSERSPGPGADHPVLVGVDGSAPSDEALGFALEEASFRGVPLVVARMWADAPGDAAMVPYLSPSDVRLIEAEQHRLLSEQLAGWSARYPDVRVRTLVLRGAPAAHLVELHRGSPVLPATPALIVVGSRGRGGFAGLLLGSVGQALAANAERPVCIVRPRRR